MSAAKLPLKPTDKDCQRSGERDAFWPALMPGLITSNYREEEQSKASGGAALECVRPVGHGCHKTLTLKPTIFWKCWKSSRLGFNAGRPVFYASA